MILKIYNAKVIFSDSIAEEAVVYYGNGKILYAGPENEAHGNIYADEGTDARGMYVSPGFIDMHTHGGGGSDFMDATKEAFITAGIMHAIHGTTTLLPTTLACDTDELLKVIKVFEAVRNNEMRKENYLGSDMPGLHLEGPYFSMNQRGAQDPEYIKEPVPSEYIAITDSCCKAGIRIMRWTAAPELKGAMEFAEYLKSKGILPCIGHSDAIYSTVEEAFKVGFTHVTHLYSGMSGVVRINGYRYPGVIESAFIIDDMTVEVIADGKHLPGSLLKMIYKIKGADRITLVTDSMRGAGMPDGRSILGSLEKGQEVIIENGVAVMPDRKAFAGSVATADLLVRNMVKIADVPLTDAVKMMTGTPARILGIGSKTGSLDEGMDADIVIFDDDINIKMTIVKGRIVYCDM